MENPNELYNLLQALNKSLNAVLKCSYIDSFDKKLERFLYSLEKIRLKFMSKSDF